jgi:hypothetical protein
MWGGLHFEKSYLNLPTRTPAIVFRDLVRHI